MDSFRQALVALYECLGTANSAHQQVGYSSRLQQLAFYEILLGVAGRQGLDGCSVLDAGCGWGGFYEFLRGRGMVVRYTGVDLVPHLVSEARRRFPSAWFVLGDLIELDLPQADYVVASGLFDYRLPGMEERLRRSVAALYRSCRRGLAWNKFLLSACSRPEHYGEPMGELLRVCTELTPLTAVRQDYCQGHATLFMFKPAAFASPQAESFVGKLFQQPSLRSEVEEDPEPAMREFGLDAQDLQRLLSIVRYRPGLDDSSVGG